VSHQSASKRDRRQADDAAVRGSPPSSPGLSLWPSSCRPWASLRKRCQEQTGECLLNHPPPLVAHPIRYGRQCGKHASRAALIWRFGSSPHNRRVQAAFGQTQDHQKARRGQAGGHRIEAERRLPPASRARGRYGGEAAVARFTAHIGLPSHNRFVANGRKVGYVPPA